MGILEVGPVVLSVMIIKQGFYVVSAYPYFVSNRSQLTRSCQHSSVALPNTVQKYIFLFSKALKRTVSKDSFWLTQGYHVFVLL